MSENKPLFFPGLNGLRAIAALAVVASHTTITLAAFGLNAHIIGTLANGNPKGIDLSDFAVSIFFSLSGFLITYLLMREEQDGGINIRNFYIRRILRIWPLYYLYYILASIVILLWKLPHDNSTAVFYIFFTANVPKILQLKSELLGHFWSLGVEEQFYLFWPWIVVKMHQKLGKTTLTLLLILIALKLVSHFVFPGTYFETAMYVNRFDCMMIGSLGALLFFWQNEWFMAICKNGLTRIFAWTAIVLAAFNHFHIASVLDHELMSVFTVVLIVGQIAAPVKVFNLNNRLFEFLGKISFGIYVYHPLVLFFLAKIPLLPAALPPVFHYIWVYAAVAGGTILVAYLSYEFIEKRFLKMKLRYSPVTPNASSASGPKFSFNPKHWFSSGRSSS